MLRGMATVTYYADDVKQARAWYAELLGVEAYFEVPGPDDQPAYIEFRIGDYQHELGITNAKFNPHAQVTEPSGAIVFWHVDDIDAAIDRLIAMGATVNEPKRVLTQGFAIASVVDPFGNLLGVMNNPHYLQILTEKGGQS